MVLPPAPHPLGTYLNHGATGLEREEEIDVGAVGHASAGAVGQKELQATHQLTGDADLDSV